MKRPARIAVTFGVILALAVGVIAWDQSRAHGVAGTVQQSGQGTSPSDPFGGLK